MGMTASYIMVSAPELEKLRIGGNDAAFAIMKRRADPACWFTGSDAEEQAFAEAQQAGFHLWIDLDKTFREVYWLFTGNEFPEVEVVHLRGTQMNSMPPGDPLSTAMCAPDFVPGTEDFGYGPVRYVPPENVHNIADVLKNTTWSELAKLRDIEVEEGDSLYWGFTKIQNLYFRASTSNAAVLQCFT